MEDSVEIVIEKLLHVSKDSVPKVNAFLEALHSFPIVLTSLSHYFYIYIQVSSESEHCLTIVLSQYDPFRCLSVS